MGDLQVQVKDSILNVSGKRSIPVNKVLTFSRQFQLDTTSIDPKKITADLINGVLVITAYKKEKLIDPIKIAINEEPKFTRMEECADEEKKEDEEKVLMKVETTNDEEAS